MDRDAARAWLGLPPHARAAEIEQAYTRHARPLKRRLVEARTLEEREKWRAELKRMIYIRDQALGPEAARARRLRRRSREIKDWWEPEMDVPGDVTDQRVAADFFGSARPDAIRLVFFARSRKLKQCVAHARTQERATFYQNALRRLNELLRVALDASLSDSSFDVLAR